MRLLHVLPAYRPSLAFGGITSLCANLAEAMAARGHQVTVLTTDAASRTTRVDSLVDTIEGVAVERLRNVIQRGVAVNLFTPWSTRKALLRLLPRIDLVHVHDFFTWLSFRAAVEAARLGLPVVLSGHGTLSLSQERGRIPIKHAWMALLGRPTIAASTVVQASVGNEVEQCIRAGVPRHKIRVIPQSVAAPPRTGDGAAFRAKYALDARPILLFAGRLRASKGVDLLLEVARALASHPARPLFVLAGAAENRPDLQAYGMRPDDNTLLTGPLDQANLADAYAAASAFVLPSFAETMPLVALDALAFGLPVVVSRACNLEEAERCGAGILVDAEVSSLRAGVERLLALRDRWPEMAAAGRQFVSERYTHERVHTQYEDLYRELASA